MWTVLALSEPVSGTVFPAKPGNAIFFQPHLEFDLEKLLEQPNQRYYLIVYTQHLSLYYPQPGDPFGHVLKKRGYNFNDKLNDKLHPVIYR